jgi:hypothetical protein
MVGPQRVYTYLCRGQGDSRYNVVLCGPTKQLGEHGVARWCGGRRDRGDAAAAIERAHGRTQACRVQRPWGRRGAGYRHQWCRRTGPCPAPWSANVCFRVRTHMVAYVRGRVVAEGLVRRGRHAAARALWTEVPSARAYTEIERERETSRHRHTQTYTCRRTHAHTDPRTGLLLRHTSPEPGRHGGALALPCCHQGGYVVAGRHAGRARLERVREQSPAQRHPHGRRVGTQPLSCGAGEVRSGCGGAEDRRGAHTGLASSIRRSCAADSRSSTGRISGTGTSPKSPSTSRQQQGAAIGGGTG